MAATGIASLFFCDPVVLESICYCKRAKRLINKDNTTGGLRKIWTGGADFYLRSSRIGVDLLSYESIPTDKREKYD